MNILEFQIYNFDEHLCVEQGRLRNMANTITNNKLLMAGEKIEDSPVKILGTILKYIFLNLLNLPTMFYTFSHSSGLS